MKTETIEYGTCLILNSNNIAYARKQYKLKMSDDQGLPSLLHIRFYINLVGK